MQGYPRLSRECMRQRKLPLLRVAAQEQHLLWANRRHVLWPNRRATSLVRSFLLNPWQLVLNILLRQTRAGIPPT